jgi:superfamily II DNA helicase RecQ
VVRYGSEVRHAGRPGLLAHPNSEEAWERLRVWRGEKARTLSLPAFVIFDDATLRQVAARLPVSEPALLAVKGIGPAKLDSYGSELIAMTEELRPP